MKISKEKLKSIVLEELELEKQLILRENLLKGLYNKLVSLFKKEDKPEQLDINDIIEYEPEQSMYPDTAKAYRHYNYLIRVKKYGKKRAFNVAILPIIRKIQSEIRKADQLRKQKIARGEL